VPHGARRWCAPTWRNAQIIPNRKPRTSPSSSQVSISVECGGLPPLLRLQQPPPNRNSTPVLHPGSISATPVAKVGLVSSRPKQRRLLPLRSGGIAATSPPPTKTRPPDPAKCMPSPCKHPPLWPCSCSSPLPLLADSRSWKGLFPRTAAAYPLNVLTRLTLRGSHRRCWLARPQWFGFTSHAGPGESPQPLSLLAQCWPKEFLP
jgi:hypothetical protein